MGGINGYKKSLTTFCKCCHMSFSVLNYEARVTIFSTEGNCYSPNLRSSGNAMRMSADTQCCSGIHSQQPATECLPPGAPPTSRATRFGVLVLLLCVLASLFHTELNLLFTIMARFIFFIPELLMRSGCCGLAQCRTHQYFL